MTDTELDELIKRSMEAFDKLSPEEQEKMRREQRESYVRAEMAWPEPKFKWVDGVKVYESLEDYYNG